ncbi:MAG: rhomboid family intramembrane serine protease [Spirochaetes bacterium]|nr:rhomboid family intramembrane serine protease [Spirochaetota bacterium]
MINAIRTGLFFLFLVWAVYLIDLALLFIDFTAYGIYPRNVYGLIGIITWPFLHADWPHILSNSMPLLVLLVVVFTFFKRIAWPVTIVVVTLGGLLVWIFGRPYIHIGASGLIYGLVAFLFFCGLFRGDFKSILIAVIVALAYGGLIYGVFSSDPTISWEGHLFGAGAGAFSAFVFRKVKEN